MKCSLCFGESHLKWLVYAILAVFLFSFACAQTEAKWPVEGWDFDIYNVSLSENVVNPNETLYVTVTIENTGTKLGTVHVYLGIENPSGSRIYLGPRTIFDIPVGGRDTTTFNWSVPSNAEGGTYKVTVDVYNPPETHMFDTSGFIYNFEVMSPARLTVTVRKPSGELMPGSEINGLVLYQDNYSNDIQNVDPSSSSYTFENLSPGHSYLVEVYVTDMYAGDTSWVYMGSGYSESKTIYCPVYGTLNFQVFYSDGTTPLGNAYVEVYGGTQAWRSGSTDTQGKTIDFYLMPTTLASNQSYYAIVKYNEQQVGSVYGIQLSPGENKPTIKIITDENPPGGDLTVTVRKPSGELMPGSEINGLVLYQDNYSNDIQNVDPSSSSYTFENLSPGHSYLVEVYVTDMYAGDTSWVYMGSGYSESKTIYCPVYGTLNFQVFYSDGTTPLGNAYVEVYGGTQAWRSGSTDTQGKTIDFYLMPTTLASNQSYYAIVKYNEQQVGSVYGIQLSPGENKPTLQIITTVNPPPISEKGWGCWLYGKQDSFANDINSYNEQASFEERIRYIFAYSGTLDLQTLNLSYDTNITEFYAQRISGAYVLPMIDSGSGLSSLTSTQLDTLSANVAMKLNNDPYASGVHFNIEPDDPKLPEFLMYLRSYINRSDFIITVTVGKSSVSSEFPITFWENLFFQADFIVLMNYDLASDIQEGDCSYGSIGDYYLKAKSKVTELLQLASSCNGYVMIGVPGIATHHEFEMRVKNDGTIEYSGHAMIEYLESGLDAVEATLQEVGENDYIGVSIWSFLNAPIGSWCDPNCPGICDRLWDYYPFEIGVNATIENTTIDYGPYSSGDVVVASVKIINYETLRLLNNDYPLHIGFSVRSPSGIIFDAPSKVGSFEGNTFFETQFSWNVPDNVELGLYDATVAVWVDVNRNGIIDEGDSELDRWGWSQHVFEVFAIDQDTPVFGNLPSLFPSNSYHVVGDLAACTDVLGTANVSWAYGSAGISRPDGKTEGILFSGEHNTSNLMLMGGPAVSGITDEFDTYFDITYDWQPGVSFTIFCEGQQIYLDLTKYPSEDICIVYLDQQNNRNVLVIWGYGWEGTYAGSAFMSNPEVWNAYPNKHLLLLRWTDDNSNGFIEFSEVHPENVPEIPIAPPSEGTPQLLDPVFSNIPSLFAGDSFHVVGDLAACTDVLGTANVSWAYGSAGISRPDGKTEGILFSGEHNTSNLMLMGGPAVSGITDEFDTYFDITYDWQPGVSFTIFCEGQQIYLDLAKYPSEDICIVYLDQQNSRNVLVIWGYGWQGTYAGSVFMSDPSNWSLYGNNHLLMLRWNDLNSDGFIQMNEITTETNQPPIVTLLSPNGGETLTAGGQFDIFWEASDAEDGENLFVHLYYSTDGGVSFPFFICIFEQNDGHYLWNVPDISCSTCKVLIQVTDTEGLPGEDKSNGDFTISEFPTSIEIVDTWQMGGVVGEAQSGLAWDGLYLWSIVNGQTMFMHDPNNVTSILYDSWVPGTGEGIAWDGANMWVTHTTSIFKLNGIDGKDYNEIILSESTTGTAGLTWRDGYIWAVNHNDLNAEIRKIDPNDGTVLEKYTFRIESSTHDTDESNASSIEWDPYRGVFWLGLHRSNIIYMLDGNDPRNILQTYVVEGITGADGLALGNNGEVLWASSVDGGFLYKLTLVTNSPQNFIIRDNNLFDYGQGSFNYWCFFFLLFIVLAFKTRVFL